MCISQLIDGPAAEAVLLLLLLANPTKGTLRMQLLAAVVILYRDGGGGTQGNDWTYPWPPCSGRCRIPPSACCESQAAVFDIASGPFVIPPASTQTTSGSTTTSKHSSSSSSSSSGISTSISVIVRPEHTAAAETRYNAKAQKRANRAHRTQQWQQQQQQRSETEGGQRERKGIKSDRSEQQAHHELNKEHNQNKEHHQTQQQAVYLVHGRIRFDVKRG